MKQILYFFSALVRVAGFWLIVFSPAGYGVLRDGGTLVAGHKISALLLGIGLSVYSLGYWIQKKYFPEKTKKNPPVQTNPPHG